MSTAANIFQPRLMNIQVTDDEIIAHLADGRTITVPLVLSWRLSEATPEPRQHFEIFGDGQGVHWPEIDADICVEGMLHRSPACVPSKSRRQEA